jgi:hypothetical protein
LENNPRQPSDCAIYVFMKIDDDESTSADNATATFSQNEQVAVCQAGVPPTAGIVVANEAGGIAGDAGNAMETDGAAVATFRVRVAGEVVPRIGVAAAALMNIRQQWVTDFGSEAKVSRREEGQSVNKVAL